MKDLREIVKFESYDEACKKYVDDFFDSNANVQFAFDQVQNFLMPVGFEKFRKEFANVNKI